MPLATLSPPRAHHRLGNGSKGLAQTPEELAPTPHPPRRLSPRRARARTWRVAADLSALVGRTPLLALRRLAAGLHGRLLVKLESWNPSGSVKDRSVLAMLEDAERTGLLPPGGTVIEATSGRAGIALAAIGAARGYRVVVVAPDDAGENFRNVLSLHGAAWVTTPARLGMAGADARAAEIAARTEGAFLLSQFSNPANPRAHRLSTAREIWADTGGRVDVVVAGIGTGGTATGLAQALKPRKRTLRIVGVEPAGSPVLTGGHPGPHGIVGIGAGFRPDVLRSDLLDEIVAVSDENAADTCRRLAREEGLLLGLSSGAAVCAAVREAERPFSEGKVIVAVCPDAGEPYAAELAGRDGRGRA